jgi:hypothetical protein
MAWIPAEDDMTVATHIEPIGAAADTNNTIRTPAASARFFPQSLISQPDSFQPNVVVPK